MLRTRMPLFFLTLVTVFPALLGVNAGSFNYSYCAEIASTIFYENPNNISLYDEHGEPTSNLSKAWGISYYDCKNTCGAQDNTGYYDWGFLSQGVASWLIPWLALSAQLPFETKGQTTNLVALFLAIGSPALITYSLALRILGARWINSNFRQVKENNATLRRPLQTKAIKAARSILIETQHVPIQVYNGPRREIAQLIVNPENWAWWCSLQNRILIRKRKWTYSLYAQVGWVCLTQLLAIIDFFTSASSNSTIGIGLAINSLWLWMIPITLGWVYVGTQDSAGSIKAALVDTIVPSLAPDRNNNGECFGFRDRTVADDSSMTPQDSFNGGEQAPQHEEASPINSFLDSGLPKIDPEIDRKHTDPTLSISPRELEKPPVSLTDHPENSYTSHSEHLELYGHSRYPLKGPESTLTTLEGQTQSLSDDLVCSSLLRQNFLGFSVAGDEIEPGPIFNYARVWSHMSAANHVAESFRRFTVRQKMRQPVTHGKSWNKCLDRWDENLQGTPQEMSKYISSDNSDAEIFPVHAPASARLALNCVTAAFVAMFLQWGTTGAAIVIAYKTPVIGLGCQSGSYLIYGLASTLSWLILVSSAYLSQLYSLSLEISSPNHKSQIQPSSFLAASAVVTRLIGKSLAAANAIFIVATSVLQFTGLYDNCWCDACIPSVGKKASWVVLFASDAQIAAASKNAWIGGVYMGISVGVVVSVWVFVASNEILYNFRKRMFRLGTD